MAESVGPRATSSELYAMSRYLGVRCNSEEITYLDCKDKHNHPEDCIPEAKRVVRCSQNL